MMQPLIFQMDLSLMRLDVIFLYILNLYFAWENCVVKNSSTIPVMFSNLFI